jgi:hypothetical protein
MIVRLFILIAGAVMVAGFLWFAGNIIHLGIKEFFKNKNSTPAATPSATPVATLVTAAPAATVATSTTP